jgi:hypothetical protein
VTYTVAQVQLIAICCADQSSSSSSGKVSKTTSRSNPPRDSDMARAITAGKQGGLTRLPDVLGSRHGLEIGNGKQVVHSIHSGTLDIGLRMRQSPTANSYQDDLLNTGRHSVVAPQFVCFHIASISE